MNTLWKRDRQTDTKGINSFKGFLKYSFICCVPDRLNLTTLKTAISGLHMMLGRICLCCPKEPVLCNVNSKK